MGLYKVRVDAINRESAARVDAINRESAAHVAAIERESDARVAAIKRETVVAEKSSPALPFPYPASQQPDSIPDKLIDIVNTNCAAFREELIDVSNIEKYGLQYCKIEKSRESIRDVVPSLRIGTKSTSPYLLLEEDSRCLLYPDRRSLNEQFLFFIYFDAIYDRGSNGAGDLTMTRLIKPAQLKRDGNKYSVVEKGEIQCEP